METHSVGSREGVTAGHFADHEHRRERRAGAAGEEAGHADDRKGLWLPHEFGPPLVEDLPHGGAEAAADHHRGAEYTAGAAGADREARGEDLQQGDGHQQGNCHTHAVAQALLERAVAAAENGEGVGVVAKRLINPQAHQASQGRPDHRLDVRWQRKAFEEVVDAVERADVEHTSQHEHDGHRPVGQQFEWGTNFVGDWLTKQRGEPQRGWEPEAEHRVGDRG